MEKWAITIITSIAIFSSSCIYDPGNSDITIINSTTDSLYYYVHDYKSENEYTYNFAYDSIAAYDTAKRRYDIAYNINGNQLLPHDTIHPSINASSWKIKAVDKGGLTFLFYRRDIQQLSENKPLTYKNIYKRIDLTTTQLDSLKYKIELEN
jgi:hypothetical protein